MFTRLFAESGLSLERLRSLVEVGAYGSIVKAADGDPARQSLYSRQLKELESFFRATLVERHGKGVRLTSSGRELARISRFFLMGLSNFQRGCLAEGQSYRLGADATFNHCFLLPLLSESQMQPGIRFRHETVNDAEVERRLHDLTLDFGIVRQRALSRPLQMKGLGNWQLCLWAPRALCKNAALATRAFRANRLPLVWPVNELDPAGLGLSEHFEPALACDDFVQARRAMVSANLSGYLPAFLSPEDVPRKFFKVPIPELQNVHFGYSLAWNPRLLRLNPHASRRRDILIQALADRLDKRLSSGLRI
ncbi:MAG TPA: LysR family transcriptional regulator [Verrucomicrobiae bacterium]